MQNSGSAFLFATSCNLSARGKGFAVANHIAHLSSSLCTCGQWQRGGYAHRPDPCLPSNYSSGPYRSVPCRANICHVTRQLRNWSSASFESHLLYPKRSVRTPVFSCLSRSITFSALFVSAQTSRRMLAIPCARPGQQRRMR